METESKVIATRPVTNGSLVQPQPAPMAGMPPQENYVNGFDGMASAPFPKEALEVLREPVNPEDVEIKPDGIVYMPGIFYRDRLMRAFGPGGWAIAPRGPAKRAPSGGGECVMYHGALVCLGRYVSEAVGQCVYFPNNRGMQYADAFEGAKTDCITRCCKDLGVARELWDPGWRTQWQNQYAQQVWKVVKGERVQVWERKGRAQKLPGAAAPAGASAATASPTASTPAPGSASAALSSDDDGEAITDVDVKNLETLIRQLGWKKQWTGWWFMRRFGVKYQNLTRVQLRSAIKLLYCFTDVDRYNAVLAEEAAAGHCMGRKDDEDLP